MIPCVNNSSPLTLSDNDYTLGTGRIRGAQTIDVDLIRGIGQYPYLINADSPNLPTADEYIINNIVFIKAGEMLQYATPTMNNGVYSVRFYEENADDFTDWQPIFNGGSCDCEYTTLITKLDDGQTLNTAVYNEMVITMLTDPLISLEVTIINDNLLNGQKLILRKPFTGGFAVNMPYRALIEEVESAIFEIEPTEEAGKSYEFIYNLTDIIWEQIR